MHTGANLVNELFPFCLVNSCCDACMDRVLVDLMGSFLYILLWVWDCLGAGGVNPLFLLIKG